MHEYLDLTVVVDERPLLHGPAAYEVSVLMAGTDQALHISPVLYRTRNDAQNYASDLHGEMFAARCDFCGESADFIEDIDSLLGSHEFVVISWCSEDCRNESKREDYELARAGL